MIGNAIPDIKHPRYHGKTADSIGLHVVHVILATWALGLSILQARTSADPDAYYLICACVVLIWGYTLPEAAQRAWSSTPRSAQPSFSAVIGHALRLTPAVAITLMLDHANDFYTAGSAAELHGLVGVMIAAYAVWVWAGATTRKATPIRKRLRVTVRRPPSGK